MDLMAEYPDKHFELAIVDPPYSIKQLSVNENRNPNSKYRRSMSKMLDSAKKWNHKKPSPEYFIELFRVSKNQIIWGANNFKLPPTEYFIVWDKMQTIDNFASAEYAWTNCKMPAKVFRYGIHEHNNNKSGIHPTEKPVKLYRWLLENYAKPGDKILDTHLGSGSIAIACHYMGFDLTACELDKDYYEAAMKRIERETAQVSMF